MKSLIKKKRRRLAPERKTKRVLLKDEWECGRCGKILKKNHACPCFKGKFDKETERWIPLEEENDEIGEIW